MRQTCLYSGNKLHANLNCGSTRCCGVYICIVCSYVVDSGREKRRVFATGSECFSYFTVTLTSQAAAQQRAGRAGRVGAGVCYRLYSSAVYEHEMERYPPPQIHTVPLDHLLLFMAALGRCSSASIASSIFPSFQLVSWGYCFSLTANHI